MSIYVAFYNLGRRILELCKSTFCVRIRLCRPPLVIDSRACVPVAGLRHLASPRPLGAECGSGERLCCGLAFRLWTASPDSFSRRSLITSTFNRFRTAQKPRDKPWLDGYRRVLSTAAQGKLLAPERRAP